MSLNKFYKTYDMGFISDKFETYDNASYFKYTGTVPTWFSKEIISPLAPTLYFPTFTYLPPKGTSGTFTFGIEKYDSSLVLVGTGIVTITIQEQTQAVWNIEQCLVSQIIWLDPSGGWESYMFQGKQQLFQDKGSSATYINAEGESRFHRKDDVFQGVIVTTGKVSPVHADYIADAFKSIQAYLIYEFGSVPIIINPRSFKKVRAGDSYAQYEFDFRHAVEDVIQTQ